MRVALALGLALVAVAATACKERVDTQDFEGRLRKRVSELGLPPSKVTCPKDVVVQTGTTFACNVEIEGKSYELDATIEQAEGSAGVAEVTLSTRWKRGDAIVAARLAPNLSTALTRTLSTPITVSCGEALRFLDADRTVRCDLTAGKTKAAIITTFDAKVDPIGWKLDPPMLSRSALEATLGPEIQAKTAPDAWVWCGSEPLLPRPPDGIVPCKVGVGGHEAKIAVTVDPSLEIKRWEIVTDGPSPK